MTSPFKIDTKGTCIFCLSPETRQELEVNGGGGTHNAFKMLLRYLKVDVRKLVESMSSVQPFVTSSSLECVKLLVSVCQRCSALAKDFLDLFQDYDNIRLQLDLCVGQLHELMEEGGKDRDRVREYERRKNEGSVADWMSTKVGETLRKELKEKALRKVESTVPRVSLPGLDMLKDEGVINDSPESHLDSEIRPQTPSPQRLVVANDENMDVVSLTQPPKSGRSRGHKPTLRKCDYCVKHYTQGGNLRRHQLQIHAWSYLSANGILPSTITKYQLDKAVGNILGKMKHPNLKCPYCDKCNFRARCDVKPHLLQTHLDQIVDNAKKILRSPKGRQEPKPKRWSWRCVPCGQTFPRKVNLERHRLSKHLNTVLKDVLPASVSEQSLLKAIRVITSGSIILSRNKYGQAIYECPLCKKVVWTRLKNHLIEIHVDQVIQEVEKNEHQ